MAKPPKPAKKFKGDRKRNMNRMVAQHDPAPIRKASPEMPNAAPAANMFSRAWDGFAIGPEWLSWLAINNDSVLKREGGSHDLALYDALLDDDMTFSTFQQRQLALISRPWVVSPGDEKDPRSVQAADDLRDMLSALGWDRVCRGMTFSNWYGYGVGEGILETKQVNGRWLVWLSDIVVPNRAWYAFTNAGELRLRSPTEAAGLPVPANKFWTMRVGATHDFALYGTGLAHWCYWPVWFKRNVQQFWALYLEKFGQPTAVGFFPAGASQDDINELLAALKAIGTDSAVALPTPAPNPTGTAGADLRPQLMEAERSGGADSYKQFIDMMNEAIMGVILSQTMTSKAAASGLGSNQADVHKTVRDEVVKADSDTLHESFNATFPVWLTLWNYGPDVKPPTVYRDLEDGEDLNTTAERDTALDGLGWQRTDENFAETYGDGYERKPPPPPPPPMVPGMRPGANGGPAINDNAIGKARAAATAFAADDPAPLYVSRQLTNAAEVLAWARGQGFTDLMDAADLHVTVLYSRTPVDWFAMDDRWGMRQDVLQVAPGGARKVEPMGVDGVVALVFGSSELRYRHDSMVEQGASHDCESYLPHVSFANSSAGVDDLTTVEPFVGELNFGPEIFEPINDGPALMPAGIAAFSADQLDAIDALTHDLCADTDADFVAMGEALKDKLAAFSATGTVVTADMLRVAMLQAWESFPIDRLAARMSLPIAATRVAAAVGAEDDVRP